MVYKGIKKLINLYDKKKDDQQKTNNNLQLNLTKVMVEKLAHL